MQDRSGNKPAFTPYDDSSKPFTIVAVLRGHPDVARLASSFAAQLEELNPEQAAYKGLASKRDSLIAARRHLAAG